MIHLRHVSLESDGDDDGGPTRSPSRLLSRRTSSSLSSRKQSAKNDLHGSQHSERSSSKQNRRSSAASQKSNYTQSSQDTRGVEEYSSGGTGGRLHNSQQPQASSQFHGAQYFQNPHPLNGSSLFSTGSSMSSRQSVGSQNDNFVPATPVASNKTNRGSSRRSSKMMVQSTPVSQMSSPLSKSSRRSNPQTPPGSASPSVRKVKPRKKPLDETQGTYRNSSEQDRSTSTRTSYAANSFSLHSSDDRNFSSDDGGDSRLTRERGGSPSGKKRRPKAAGEAPPSSPTRRKSSVTIPQSPQRKYSHSSGAESPVQTSPNNGKVLRRKKRRPKKPGEPDSPGGRPGGNADFHDGFESTDSAEKDVSTDDELHAEPRRNPPPRRAKRRPTKSSENLAPRDSSRAHYSPARGQTSPMQHPYSSTAVKHPPTRTQSLISTSDEELRIAPSRRISFDTYFTQSSAPTASSTTRLYEFARRCQWDDVMRECEANPRDAKTVGEKDGTTALHLAIMSRTNPMMRDGKVGSFKPASLDLIEKLVEACPEAGSTRCTRKRYTPLAYACLVADVGFDMDDSSEMVLILMKHAPGSVFVFTDDGFSAVDIHILSYSQIHKQKQEVYSGGRTSSVVLRTLLAECPELAESRIYRHKVRGPIELLYRCNTSEFQDAMIDDLTGDASDVKKKQLKSRFGSVASVLSDWWAWKWVLLLLKFSTIKDKKPGTIFSAVQAAARLVACPLPILALAINTFPHQVEDRDPRGDIYNLPLHEVSSWRADEAILSGDPFVAGRKLKAVQLLLNEYPDASRMTNNMGETPLQLAVETCTPWHGGLELLVESCPKALKFPRKLRMGDHGLCLSVQNPSALSSVNSYDSDENDPMMAMEGMYPFALGAVLGGVSPNKGRIPLDYTEEQKVEHLQQLKQRGLQAVRIVYGLLRSRPDVLEKYRKDVTRDYLKMLKAMEND